MEIKKCIKDSFAVIGKEGSTNDGEGFIDNLWKDANSHFNEVSNLARKDEQGNLHGIWGLMSNFSKSFKPWEDNFSKGLYLAGVEVMDNVEAPLNWIKWTVPAFEYLYVRAEGHYQEAFSSVLDHMKKNNIELAGAVFEYMCPEENGQLYLFFPIRRL